MTPDPYSTYLSLPPGPRPPNYYELLQLELFCSHHERINQAVRKQFRIIKRYHDHHDRETREVIQNIMNAIATARVVLTDPARKEDYDEALAQEMDIDRDAHLAAQLAAPLPEYEIVVIAGPSLVRQRFELVEGTRITIGSHTHCLLTLSAGRTAERHCVVHHIGGDWIIKSAKPELAIRVNDTATPEFVLADGDKIDVGGYRLLFSRLSEPTDGEGDDDIIRSDRPGDARRPGSSLPPPPKEVGHPASRHSTFDIRYSSGPPPLSLIIQKGPSIPTPVFNALAPQRFVIGHSESALWQLPDNTVSRSQCAIQSVGDRWEILDLQSTNGTFVNNTQVSRRLLNDRDLITIGSFEILVSLRF